MRLVDADALLEYKFPNGFSRWDEQEIVYAVHEKDILSAPTVDAEPTVHAHWVTVSDADGLYYCCSNCGEDLPRYYTERPTWDNPFPNMESIDKTPRCPCCGAKMNEEVEK